MLVASGCGLQALSELGADSSDSSLGKLARGVIAGAVGSATVATNVVETTVIASEPKLGQALIGASLNCSEPALEGLMLALLGH